MVMNKILDKIKAFKMPKFDLNMLKPYLDKIYGVLKKAPALSLKAVKGFIVWLGKAIKESIAQLWTLLGFFIAWLTLTGTAQQVVGIATILTTIIWLVTIPLREEKEED